MRGIEWGAGIIEGEGSLFMKGGRTPVVSVEMTDKDVLKEIQRIFGGYLYQNKARKNQPKHWKKSWRWQVCGDLAIETLIKIRPFLLSRRSAEALKIINKHKIIKKERIGKENEVLYKRKQMILLREKGLTQKAIGNKLGLSRSYVGKCLISMNNTK